MSIARTSVTSTSVGGAGLGGGATLVSVAGGLAAVTGGRASAVVVGAFFAQAARGSRTSARSAAIESVVMRLFIPYSLGPRSAGGKSERCTSKSNIAKSLRKPQSHRAILHGTQNGWRWLPPCVSCLLFCPFASTV